MYSLFRRCVVYYITGYEYVKMCSKYKLLRLILRYSELVTVSLPEREVYEEL